MSHLGLKAYGGPEFLVSKFRVRSITLLYMKRFGNNLAEMIIVTRRCVVNNSQACIFKVKVPLNVKGILPRLQILYPAEHGGIWQYPGTNDHCDKTICSTQQ